MSNLKIDIEKQLTSLGREIQQFVERLTPMDDDRDFSPACDIVESDRQFTIMADLPGMEKEQVTVTMKDRVLKIEGTRELYLEEDEQLKREERAQGSFIRSFSIPDHADASTINAAFKNGVLTIRIDKKGSGDSEADSIPIN
ncbi:MAG: Hsp20 family protein [Bacteroidetes bacterium]|jgi:HSP20 family protein|nr:Hsp20 family protein [Bacteroidota bacterium]